MKVPHAIRNTAQTGADSVFGYIARTAEMVPEGVRWQTYNDVGEPQYRADLYSNGGIPIFLADYYRLAGNGLALELGLRCARWCASPSREYLADRFSCDEDWGLLGGRTGLGWAWLRLADASGEPSLLERAIAVAVKLLERAPGPHTGLGTGAAGQGIFLLRLWEHTRDAQHLAGAVRQAKWLGERAIRTEIGCHWLSKAEAGQPAQTSTSHGVAGVGYFLLLLYGATGDRQYADLVRQSVKTIGVGGVRGYDGAKKLSGRKRHLRAVLPRR